MPESYPHQLLQVVTSDQETRYIVRPASIVLAMSMGILGLSIIVIVIVFASVLLRDRGMEGNIILIALAAVFLWYFKSHVADRLTPCVCTLRLSDQTLQITKQDRVLLADIESISVSESETPELLLTHRDQRHFVLLQAVSPLQRRSFLELCSALTTEWRRRSTHEPSAPHA